MYLEKLQTSHMTPGTHMSSSHNEREKMLFLKSWGPSTVAVYDPKCWDQFQAEMGLGLTLISVGCAMYPCPSCTAGPKLFRVRQSLSYLRTKSLFSCVICLVLTCSTDVGRKELNAKT